MAIKEIARKRKFNDCHKKSISLLIDIKLACERKRIGVAIQCIRQSPLAIAPTISGLFRLKLIIEFFVLI